MGTAVATHVMEAALNPARTPSAKMIMMRTIRIKNSSAEKMAAKWAWEATVLSKTMWVVRRRVVRNYVQLSTINTVEFDLKEILIAKQWKFEKKKEKEKVFDTKKQATFSSWSI